MARENTVYLYGRLIADPKNRMDTTNYYHRILCVKSAICKYLFFKPDLYGVIRSIFICTIYWELFKSWNNPEN